MPDPALLAKRSDTNGFQGFGRLCGLDGGGQFVL
jgi:hypothetical protein